MHTYKHKYTQINISTYIHTYIHTYCAYTLLLSGAPGSEDDSAPEDKSGQQTDKGLAVPSTL